MTTGLRFLFLAVIGIRLLCSIFLAAIYGSNSSFVIYSGVVAVMLVLAIRQVLQVEEDSRNAYWLRGVAIVGLGVLDAIWLFVSVVLVAKLSTPHVIDFGLILESVFGRNSLQIVVFWVVYFTIAAVGRMGQSTYKS